MFITIQNKWWWQIIETLWLRITSKTLLQVIKITSWPTAMELDFNELVNMMWSMVTCYLSLIPCEAKIFSLCSSMEGARRLQVEQGMLLLVHHSKKEKINKNRDNDRDSSFDSSARKLFFYSTIQRKTR